jgi:hypothetical protein
MPRGLLVLVSLSLLLAAVGCQPPQAPPAVAPGVPTQPADPNAPSADRTLEYWEGINRAQYYAAGQFAGYENPKLEDVTKLLTAVAKGVEELPAVGVDPDAIEVAHGLAESMRRLARFLEQSLSTANVVQAGIRLLFNDPGALKEQAADARELRTFIEDAAAKARKTRAVLSSRYGREFPALDAPPKKPAGPTPAQQLLATFQLFRDLEQPTARQELARLRAEIAGIEADESKMKNELAKRIVEKEKLSRELDSLRQAVKGEFVAERQKALAAKLEVAEKQFEAVAKTVEVLGEQLAALQAQRRDLQTAADELEVELRLLEPSNLKAADNTKLTELREQIEKMNKRLDVEREKLQLIDPPAKK